MGNRGRDPWPGGEARPGDRESGLGATPSTSRSRDSSPIASTGTASTRERRRVRLAEPGRCRAPRTKSTACASRSPPPALETGFFTAYRHMATEDLDLVFPLGTTFTRGPAVTASRENTAASSWLHSTTTATATRNTGRTGSAGGARGVSVDRDPGRYEVDNNYAGDLSENADPRDAFLRGCRRLPGGTTSTGRSDAARSPPGRRFSCTANSLRPTGLILRARHAAVPLRSALRRWIESPGPGVSDPQATLLGAAQEKWLLNALERSKGRWNVLPQQVMMAKVDQGPGAEERFSMDQWSGYDVPRTRLLEFFAGRKPANPVVLTGDIHTNWVNDLKVDFRDANAPAVATEFVGTSITSGGDGLDQAARMKDVLSETRSSGSELAARVCVVLDHAGRVARRYQVLDFVTKPDAPRRRARRSESGTASGG